MYIISFLLLWLILCLWFWAIRARHPHGWEHGRRQQVWWQKQLKVHISNHNQEIREPTQNGVSSFNYESWWVSEILSPARPSLLKLLRQAPTGDEVFKRLNYGGHVIQTRAPWYKACGFSYWAVFVSHWETCSTCLY